MSQQSNNNSSNQETEIQFTELTVPKGSSLKLSVLEEQPQAIVEALTEFFKQYKVVRRGFMVSAIENDDAQETPILMIALEFTAGAENIDTIIHEAGTLACEFLADDESIDFCVVNENEQGVSHFITQHVQPFYQRRLGSFLRDTIPVKNT
ncbi:enhanced serine sensitivity protein SseB C-terminal domain-containing protein [Providencia huaxiensis]|uniref:Enhanced serine sensitivity protein SseB C-terminal domain-containing protein n=1 Tax=Providencia huaxiensis TaxID=2027290 RepID=A0A345LS18_9GAMM|nr:MULTISPECIES: enhanced serine sensitivity protein SseB C-terminal domain-containing protein [Providencia]AXH60908.1 enhanced serine sensitivity protein SseB [Providencia huaxiensis]MBN6362051.1 enhanced serine sensitivity protein SseB C-terminal domain-containing protein [Providencia huaxiensis]MBQ0266899.1 enhanced serine sensitivity protein SseB C-terminal domain-containing protein [Providencia huaxiensis]MBZ3680156.1 enhanced serine sensitivity protein SseB C-terminal domain-containing pr